WVGGTMVRRAGSAGGTAMKRKWLTAAVLIAGTLTATVGGVWLASAQEKGPTVPKAPPLGQKAGKVVKPDEVIKQKPGADAARKPPRDADRIQGVWTFASSERAGKKELD